MNLMGTIDASKKTKRANQDTKDIRDLLNQKSIVEETTQDGALNINTTKQMNNQRYSVNSNKMQQQKLPQDGNNSEAYIQDEILSFNNDNLNDPRGKTEFQKTSSNDTSQKTKQVRGTPDCMQKLDSEGGMKLSRKSSLTSNSQFQSFLYDQIQVYTQLLMRQRQEGTSVIGYDYYNMKGD